MKREELKEWTDSTRKTLDTCREFSKLCCKPFDRGFIGELLVLGRLLETYKSKLCASAENGFKYAGSAKKGWDISLTLGKKTIYVNAKATTEKGKDKVNPKWVRQHARNFCNIEVDPRNPVQKVGTKKEVEDDLFYVFVDVRLWKDQGTTNLFTFSHKEAAKVFGRKYFKSWNGKIRENNPTTDDFWVEYEDVKKFRDPNLNRLFRK